MGEQSRSDEIPCVGGIVRDARGRVLLIRRAHPPGEGLWSVPGGRVERGETDEAALAREIREETGLTAVVGPLIGTTRIPAPGDAVFEIRDYAATVSAGILGAASDASDARWVTYADMLDLPLVEGLLDTLGRWDALPA